MRRGRAVGIIVAGHDECRGLNTHNFFGSSARRRIAVKKRSSACFDNPEVTPPVLGAKCVDKSGPLSQAMRPGTGLRVFSKAFAILTALGNCGYSFVFYEAPMGREFL